MAKPQPLTDDELGALVDAEMRQAVGYAGGKLAEQRRKAEAYFLAIPKGDLAPPEIAGRSKVVVPVVRNTIEAMMPQLMVKFTGGDTVVEFEPTLPDDEQKAKHCTDYLNYLFFKKNNGHSLTYSWFKDALKLKLGIVKVWWDTRDEETREEYKGQTPVNLAMLGDDPEIEIIEQRSYPDEEDAEQRQQALEQLQQQLSQAMSAAQQQQGAPQGPQGQQPQGAPQGPQGGAVQAVQQIQQRMAQLQQMPPAMLFDVSCKRTKSGGKLAIENVPSDEFVFSRKAKNNIQSAPFVAHRVLRTMSELLSMGYKQSDLEDIGSGNEDFNAERIERMAFDDDYIDMQDDPNGDPSQRRVWLVEAYLRVDADGDGIAELRKVCRCGGKTLSNEVVDAIPFVAICPIPEPHKLVGLSIADLTMDGQLTETGLLRAVMDNSFLEANGRYFAVEGQVNLDDLLSSRPGGVVRIKNQGAVGRLDQGKGNMAETMNLLEYMKGFNEDSSGWSRQSQGNSPDSIGKPETAAKANIVANKADMRLDLIARNFAEGFVELFRMMLKLVTQHQDKAASVKLSGQWVDMDPREWRNQFDVSINVGLGVGTKDQQVQHLMALIQAQGAGLSVGIATPANMYESHVELAKNMGFKSGDKFFTQPDPNAKQPDPAQGQMQIEQVKAQAQTQMKQMELQQKGQLEQAHMQQEAALEEMRAKYQAMVDQNRQQSEAQQQQSKIALEAQLQQLKEHYAAQDRQRDMDFQQWKLQMELASKERIAQINAESKIDAAQVTAQATLTAQQEQAADVAVGDAE